MGSSARAADRELLLEVVLAEGRRIEVKRDFDAETSVTFYAWKKPSRCCTQIKTAIRAARGDALAKSALAKACNYTLTLWQPLIRFLDYPIVELRNNLAENAIRPVALGRRAGTGSTSEVRRLDLALRRSSQ